MVRRIDDNHETFPPNGLGTCAWCGKVLDHKTAATTPVVVTLNFGRQAEVCQKCWRFDDGDR